MARWENRTFFVYIMGSKFGVLYIDLSACWNTRDSSLRSE